MNGGHPKSGGVFSWAIGRRFWSLLLLSLAVQSAAADSPVPEFQLKAVYLVKFLDFVDWPPSAFAQTNSPIVIGVLGTDHFGKSLEEASDGDVVKAHHVVVRRLNSIKEAADVQVLFIDSSESSRLRSIMPELEGKDILTVSDIDTFCQRGGIVGFVTENKKVRFRINVNAAKRADLQISSKLLELAEVVHE